MRRGMELAWWGDSPWRIPPPPSSLQRGLARGAVASPAMTTSLPSRANIPPAPVPGGPWGIPDSADTIWWRRFVRFKYRALVSLGKVMCALSLGKLRQKQQTRFVLTCARSQGLNMAITSLSSLWPRGSFSSCPQLLEELIPTGSYPGGRKHRAWGPPRPSITFCACRGCSRDLGLSLPRFRGPSATSQPRRGRAEDVALLQDELQRFPPRHTAPPHPYSLCRVCRQPPGDGDWDGRGMHSSRIHLF